MKAFAWLLILWACLSNIAVAELESHPKASSGNVAYEQLSLKELRSQIIDIAAQIHALEMEAFHIESHLLDSSFQLAEKEEEIKKHKFQSSLALQGLLHLSRIPPVARLFLNKDPNQSIQVGLFLQSIVKALKQETDMICIQLDKLNELKKNIALQKSSLDLIHAELMNKQSFLSKLLHTKSQLLSKKTQVEFDRKILSSKSVQELLGKIKSPAKEMKRAQQLNELYLIPPVSGKLLTMFDQKKEFTPYGRGVVIEARQRAHVVAPTQGTIVFAGPFRSYGNVVIIQAAHEYHVLLAGMGKILVNAGHDVLPGEPVGYMNAQEKQKLYLELRKNTAIVDPTPWVIKWKQ